MNQRIAKKIFSEAKRELEIIETEKQLKAAPPGTYIVKGEVAASMLKGETDKATKYFEESVKLSEDRAIARALVILERRMRVGDVKITDSSNLVAYLRLKLGLLEYEAFYIVYVNTQNMVLHHEQMFRGSINGSSVHPREIMREVFKHNASGIIIAHNHPGGSPEPSPQDFTITKELAKALSYIDCRLLDHVVITATGSYSMQAMGTLPTVK